MALSEKRKTEILSPYKTMDLAEMQFRNLDIVDTSNNINQTAKIIRRNNGIQKDFFSACEYLIYGTAQNIELPYYKNKNKKKNSILDAFIF